MPKSQAKVEVSKQELDMAKTIIESMTKINGNEIVAADNGKPEKIFS